MNYPKKILMVRPDYFRVDYVINPYMKEDSKVDLELAKKQWSDLVSIYENLGFEVLQMDGHKDYPDMVFCANQIFSHPDGIIYSKMRHPERAGEVHLMKNHFGDVPSVTLDTYFEGMGDLLWDYQGERLFGGYGYRTDLKSYDLIETTLNKKINKIKLVKEGFYHLDTCLCIINTTTAIYVRSAFQDEGIDLLNNAFKNLIQVDEEEAKSVLACNAFSPDGINVIVEKNAPILQNKLEKLKLKVQIADTSEFIKAGGSIFCLKHQLF